RFERRRSHGVERMKERAFLARLGRGVDDPELHEPERRAKVYKHFYDKLAPAARWLRKRAGQPWAEVEGEILRTFDTRTLAGRHIVFGHLMPPQWGRFGDGSWVVRGSAGGFRVDDQGVLRVEPRKRYVCRWEPEGPSEDALVFVGDRRIGLHATRRYWLVPTGNPWGHRRQHHELSRPESRRFDGLSAADRGFVSVRLS
ncbi:MAG: hypothetical protein AAGH15_07760, partial [Myxococcota bacterium]